LLARRSQSKIERPLAAGVLASGVAALFSAAVMPALLLTLLLLGALIASEEPDREPQPLPWSPAPAGFAAALAAGAVVFACLLAVSDYRLERFQRHPGTAEYASLLSLPVPVVSEDIYCSRVLASRCQAGGASSQYECWRTAVQAAARATRTADDMANAWYNLAQFTAAQNDVAGTRMALSHAIQSAPKWFKPHWAMAELAAQTGDRVNARAEEKRAESLDPKHDPELSASLASLKSKLN